MSGSKNLPPVLYQSTSWEVEPVDGIGECLHVDPICRGFVGCSVIYNKTKHNSEASTHQTSSRKIHFSQILNR